MEGTSISEIHRYPLRPEGFEEPLFPTAASKRVVAEHLLETAWLVRASDLRGGSGGATRALDEPVDVGRGRNGTRVLRRRGLGRCSWRRRRVVEILDRWREVRGWWDGVRGEDRVVFRVLLSGDEVVDLARERSGGWSLVGVVD